MSKLNYGTLSDQGFEAMLKVDDEEVICAICQEPLSYSDVDTTTCDEGVVKTDCNHLFCLKCLCRQLSQMENKCCVCRALVKKAVQLHSTNFSKPIQPALIRFCNVTYELYVSVWSVADPAKVLAQLFQLEYARLIHKGKMLKKRDIWPGSVVQLFGTKTTNMNTPDKRSLRIHACFDRLAIRIVAIALAIWLFICNIGSILYAFFGSLFDRSNERPRTAYVPINTRDSDSHHTATPKESHQFPEPGRVSNPDESNYI